MTVRQVYDRAIALINERNSAGDFHTDVGDFEKNAPSIINTAMARLRFDDAVIRGVKACDIDFENEMRTMDDEVPLHPAIASGVLPLETASLLLLEEDRSRSDWFHTLFIEARQNVLSAFASARHGSVTDVY